MPQISNFTIWIVGHPLKITKHAFVVDQDLVVAEYYRLKVPPPQFMPNQNSPSTVMVLGCRVIGRSLGLVEVRNVKLSWMGLVILEEARGNLLSWALLSFVWRCNQKWAVCNPQESPHHNLKLPPLKLRNNSVAHKIHNLWYFVMQPELTDWPNHESKRLVTH